MNYVLPKPEELLVLYRLIHELCEIGGDTLIWREKMLVEMERLTASQSSCAYLMRNSLDPTDIGPKTLVYVEHGMNDVWAKYLAVGDLSRDPVTPHIMQRFGTDFTVMRSEFVDDETWYGSDYYRDVALPSEMGDLIYSQMSVIEPRVVDGFSLVRAPDQPRYTQAEVALVRFIHQELARLWNRPDPIGVHLLPARQREVLDGIRRGESRKAIAEKMGLSEHTVHTYEKALFERAGVSSRGGLLASLSGIIRPNLLA